jgi:hypothetical protein
VPRVLNKLGDLFFGLRSDAAIIDIGYNHDLVIERGTLAMLGLFWCNSESVQTFLKFKTSFFTLKRIESARYVEEAEMLIYSTFSPTLISVPGTKLNV